MFLPETDLEVVGQAVGVFVAKDPGYTQISSKGYAAGSIDVYGRYAFTCPFAGL
ncbi:MAG: hypothetical protein PHV28_05755 [Kiritimatiellae bacterium]|nr:hypothetical protein [Kiritimatiellia bacterium]